jgi:protein SCO1
MNIELTGIRKTLMVLALALGVGIVGLAVFSWRTAGMKADPDLPDYGAVPPFSLTDRTERPVRLSDLAGKVWVVDFIFTSCPGPCPAMTSQMKRLQDELKGKRQVRLVSITVDPETDTPAVLSRYAAAVGGDPERWFFLTGPKNEIRNLANQGLHLAVAENPNAATNPEQGAIIHSTRFVLVDGRAHIRGYFDSTDDQSLQELVRGIDHLLGERSS